MRRESSPWYVKEVEEKPSMTGRKGLRGGFCWGWGHLWRMEGMGLSTALVQMAILWLLPRFGPFLSPARHVVTQKRSQDDLLMQGTVLSGGRGSWAAVPSGGSLKLLGHHTTTPLGSTESLGQRNCLVHTGMGNKIPFQPLPFSTVGNQKLLIAELRYSCHRAEAGAGTRSCTRGPTMVLVLQSCGHRAWPAWLALVPGTPSTFSSFLCPRLGIILVCSGTGWGGLALAQGGKLR